jgi:hypothetical protein
LYNKPIVERKDDLIKCEKINLDRGFPANVGSLSTILFLVVISVSLLTAASTNLMPYAAGAAVDVDVSEEGRAAAYDGEQRLSTEGESFCSITEEIVGGVFSSLFEGIAEECDGDSSQVSNQFVVDYSFSKNVVKIGEKTLLSLTVKDKNSGDPISEAIVNLKVLPSVPSFETGTVAGGASFAAAAAGSTSAVQEMENTVATQTMRTDNNGHATFTIQIGPKSDLGVYDTEVEVSKDSYESSMSQTYLRVV